MSWENILLLFTESCPCWDEELVTLAGEDPDCLRPLEEKGFLEESEGVWQLTSAGIEEFKKIASEYFYEAKPAQKTDNVDKSLLRCQLSLLLNRSFVGRWGVKNFFPGQLLPYYPDLKTEEMFSVDSSGLPVWIYKDSDIVREIERTFPHNRKNNLNPSVSGIEEWMKERNLKKGSLEMDLLFLHYCDFSEYMHKVPPASDELKLMHADRFFMKFTSREFYSDPSQLFEEIGKFHLFLFYYRHLILPGNFDLDIHQQENLNALMYITETEEEALKFYNTFHPEADFLVGPAKPLDIWSMSMEALGNHQQKEDSHFDLFEKIGHRVAITYPG